VYAANIRLIHKHNSRAYISAGDGIKLNIIVSDQEEPKMSMSSFACMCIADVFGLKRVGPGTARGSVGPASC
jgi:hypothetical protein